MVFPQIELLQRKIILVSGYERLLAERDSGDGQSGAATERHKLEDAARRNGDAVAFGFVKGAWIPAAQAISWSGWPCPAAVLEMAAYPLTLDTHSLRRTKAVLINGRTGSQRAVQLLLRTATYCLRTAG
jgi:hypothetical protein